MSTTSTMDEMTGATSAPVEARAPSGGEGPRPRRAGPIVILNQYYVPDVASTGYLLHELATELVRLGYDVGATTCRPSYGPRDSWVDCPLRETLDGVKIQRMRTTRLSKDNLLGRAINYLTFITQLGARMLFASSPKKVYLYTTNPPFLIVIGAVVSLFRRHRYVVLLHDAYPQLAVWVGTIRKGGIIERAWHALNRLAYGRAEQTIVLCQKAKDLVCETYKIPPERVHVIPNWADGDLLRPKPKRESEFAKKAGLIEPFTLLYSGNLGLCYEFETILQAAALLKGEPFRLVWIGSGGRRSWLEKQIKERGLTNTSIHPYQPFSRLSDSLAACDASLVTIAQDVEGMSYPSKLYSSLASGRAIVALSEERSELRDLVEENDVGRWFRLGDGEAMARGLREMMTDPEKCLEQGARARELFERRFTRNESAKQYARVLDLAAEATRHKRPPTG